MTTNTGGPAFPCTEENYRDPRWTSEGLSLRDYFAAKALIGFLQASAQHGWAEPSAYQAGQAAKNAYMIADAMLAARG